MIKQPDSEKPKLIIKHTVGGDERGGWYCYQCRFSTHSVEEAAQHDDSYGYAEY